VTILVLLLSPLLAPSLVRAQDTFPVAGPYVDKIEYKVIYDYNEGVLALQEDEIDLIGEWIRPESIVLYQDSEDIEISQVQRNGYGYLVINCELYPFNVTAFRRAFAFALDKEHICDEIWNGLADPQDSVVPQINPYSIEGSLPYSYYTSDLPQARAILDAAGFVDRDADGFREAPDGSSFNAIISVPLSSDIAVAIGEIAAEALTSIGIEAYSEPFDIYGYIWDMYWEIAFWGDSFSNYDLDWLAYAYWSENAHDWHWNPSRFSNSTYDSWRNQLLYSIDYETVLEAIREMQSILLYESPVIICYQNLRLNAYRVDRFEGHVNDVFHGVPGPWTCLLVRHKQSENGSLGGTFRWSLPLDVDTFNFMVSSSAYTMNVLNELYDSLFVTDPDGNDMLWLAESYTVETHLDNPIVPEGYTRFTIDLVRNATWTDGTPLTAEDVAFTLNYYRDSPDNPYGYDLADMTSATAPFAYTVVVEFYTESFWHLHNFVYKPIIPRHVFQEIELDDWNTWNPNPLTEEMVTSGPFIVSDHDPTVSIELTKNPGYFRRLNESTNTSTTTSLIPWDSISPLSLTVMISSIVVIVVILIKWELDLRK
jgi:ABC-type transport system substrate-binding protein